MGQVAWVCVGGISVATGGKMLPSRNFTHNHSYIGIKLQSNELQDESYSKVHSASIKYKLIAKKKLQLYMNSLNINLHT